MKPRRTAMGWTRTKCGPNVQGRVLVFSREWPNRESRPMWIDNPTQPIQDILGRHSSGESGAAGAARLSHPKPVALLERIISASCPSSGLVLDCFLGSGTTPRQQSAWAGWIRDRQWEVRHPLGAKAPDPAPRPATPPREVSVRLVECDKCKNIDRKGKPQKSPGTFNVRPSPSKTWACTSGPRRARTSRPSALSNRDEMIKVFAASQCTLAALHGKKGNSWIHVGPLDGPVSSGRCGASPARPSARPARR